MHTSLKTAYVRFRLPSLVERAHIPRESISARLPVSLPYVLLSSPGPPSTTSLSRFLFPPRYMDPAPVPRYLIYTSSWVLHLLQGGTVHHRVPPLRGAARNGAVRPSASDECDLEKGGQGEGGRVGRKGGRENGIRPAGCLPPLVPPQPLSTHLPTYPPTLPSTYPPSRSPGLLPLRRRRPPPPPSPNPVYQTQSLLPSSRRLLSSINFHHVNLPAPPSFPTPAATSHPSRHTTTKHSI
jgi:hypothetical protein